MAYVRYALQNEPPLRSADDRAAVIEGLADGTLEILASDHAPIARMKRMLNSITRPLVLPAWKPSWPSR